MRQRPHQALAAFLQHAADKHHVLIAVFQFVGHVYTGGHHGHIQAGSADLPGKVRIAAAGFDKQRIAF
ncbi:hypothetical protein D3C87_1843970 [compost metagenome]